MKVKPVIRASELRLYTFCPRLYFFETHVRARRPFSMEIKLMMGKLLHIVQDLLARLRGYRVERLLEVDMGSFRLRGRPDHYMVRGSTVIVVEFKSGRGPRIGAWLSDVVQVVAYALILAKLGYANVIGVIRYRRSSHIFKVTHEYIPMLLRIVDEVNLVRDHGLVPYPLRSYRKCTACIYKIECFTMDRELNIDLEEPGSWLKNIPPISTRYSRLQS